MKFTMESDFAKHVKSGEQFGVYLLYGSQTYLIERYEKLLVKKALDGDMNDFNYHRFLGIRLNCRRFMTQWNRFRCLHRAVAWRWICCPTRWGRGK